MSLAKVSVSDGAPMTRQDDAAGASGSIVDRVKKRMGKSGR